MTQNIDNIYLARKKINQTQFIIKEIKLNKEAKIFSDFDIEFNCQIVTFSGKKTIFSKINDIRKVETLCKG
jgi:hypothetical protein